MLRILTQLFLFTTLCLLSGCDEDKTLKPFKSDGCSLFPDRSLIDEKDWCECCFEHDIAYWQGGTEAQRLEADERLRDCVFTKTGDAALAEAMYQGVRLGGSPIYPNWYHWGYGWNYQRPYGELSVEEQRMVSDLLVEYFKSETRSPCD